MTDQSQQPVTLAEQLRDLRLLLDALRSDFDAAKAEGAEQVAELDHSIGGVHEYAEQLNERRCRDIDRLDAMIREHNEMLAQLRSDTERRFDDPSARTSLGAGSRTAGRW